MKTVILLVVSALATNAQDIKMNICTLPPDRPPPAVVYHVPDRPPEQRAPDNHDRHRRSLVKGFIAVSITVTIFRW